MTSQALRDILGRGIGALPRGRSDPRPQTNKRTGVNPVDSDTKPVTSPQRYFLSPGHTAAGSGLSRMVDMCTSTRLDVPTDQGEHPAGAHPGPPQRPRGAAV